VRERNSVATLECQRVANRLARRTHLGAWHTGALQSLNGARVGDEVRGR
jgi:hypothetical protein